MTNEILKINSVFFFHIILKLVESINEVSNFIVNVRYQLLNLSLGIKDFNCLSISVVADPKWSRNSGRKVNHLLLGILEALGHVVEGLVLGDRVLGHPRLLRLKTLQLGLP